MTRAFAYVVSLVLALSGITLAGAKGHVMPQGTEIVICSGVGVTTITIGPDGEPVEQVEVCPEGHATFVATFDLPELVPPEPRLVTKVEPAASRAVASGRVPVSSARGPPVPA